jgi:Tfp pilus assembly protein PilF
MAESTTEAIITETLNAEELSAKTESKVDRASNLKSSYLLPALVLVLTFFTYSGTLSYEFVYDDVTQIVDNSSVKDWSYIPGFFTSHSWAHRDQSASGNYYRPVFMIWLVVNYHLFGLNTWSWHFVTVLSHLVVTLAVFLLAERLSRDRLTAFFAALIFGLHPVHIETVAWVSGATEQMMAIPLIFSFMAYLNNREGRPKARLWFVLSLVLYMVALFDKETSVVFVGFIFTYEWVMKKDEQKNYIKRAISASIRTVPYLALAIFYLTVRVIALNGFSHVNPKYQFPIPVILMTLPSVIWGYVKLLIFPVGLSPDYDSPVIHSPGLSNFYFPLLMLALIAAGLWIVSRRKPVVQFGILMMMLPLMPILNLRIFGSSFIHDRYLYLPSVGFSLLLAMAVRQMNPGKEMFFGQPARYVAATFVLALLLVPATTFQTQVWENDVRLHYRMIETSPNQPSLRFNFADILYEKGKYKEAGEQYEKLVELMPEQYTSNYRLGYISMLSRDLDKAERHLRQAIKTAPGKNSNPYMLLGLVLKDTGRFDEAIELLNMSLKINPKTLNAHYGLGLVFGKQGKLTQALEEFNAELAINPDLPKLRDYISETERLIKESARKKEPALQPVKQQASLQR